MDLEPHAFSLQIILHGRLPEGVVGSGELWHVCRAYSQHIRRLEEGVEENGICGRMCGQNHMKSKVVIEDSGYS
jgi:hypothetical protein